MEKQLTEELKIETKILVSRRQKQSIIIKIKAPTNYFIAGEILNQNGKFESIENFIKNHTKEGIESYLRKAKEIISKIQI